METTEHYNGTIKLEYNDAKHTYQVDGVVKPSVTGIVGVINKPALIYWAVGKALEVIAEALKPGRIFDEIEKIKLLEDAKNAHRKRVSDAADIGTLAHKWIEDWINWKINDGVAPDMPVNPQINSCVSAFLDWAKKNNVEFLSTEKKIYSKKFGYAGTMDFEAMIDGKLVLGDIKTSSGIYPEMFFQTAAYCQARQEETGLDYDHRLIVRIGKALKKDGTPDFEIKELRDFKADLVGFLGCLAIHTRLNNLKSTNG